MTAAEKKPRRETVIITAKEWERRLAKLERLTLREREEFYEKRRLELSVEDLRDDAVAVIRNELGRGEQAFEIVHARGGAHPRTLHAWERKEVQRPQMPTLRASLRAVGRDIGIVSLTGAND